MGPPAAQDPLEDAVEALLARRTSLAVAPGVLLAGCASGIAFPILPIAGARAGLPLAFIGVILASNRITRVLTTPSIGWIADRVGGRRTMLWGLLIQIVVMFLYLMGTATGHPGVFFFVGRLVHGPGSAAVFVSAQALALTAGGRNHRGRASSGVRAAIGLGVPIGLVLGGLLSDSIGDTKTFEVAMLMLVLAAAAAYLSVPDLRVPVRTPIPVRQALRALAEPRLAVIGALNFATNFCAGGMLLTTTVLLVHERKISLFGRGDQGTAGATMGWMVIVDAVFMLFAGRLGDKRRAHASIAAFGLMLMIPALLVIAWTTDLKGLLIGLTIVGIGTGALGPSLLALVGETTTPESRALGVSGLQVCGDIGGALGPLVGTALFASNVTVPYVLSALLAAAFLPLAVRLARTMSRESEGREAPLQRS